MVAVQLLVGVICGVIAAAIASNKGRNVVGWFFAGLFTGIVGIIIVACLSNVKEEKARIARAESDRRRLREQLRQERYKSETFRRHSVARLDAHDNALGVDTRSTPALPGSRDDVESALRQLAGGSDAATSTPDTTRAVWYYEISGQTQGPVPTTDIRHLLNAGKIAPNTLLWTEGFSEWKPANQVETFRFMGDS